ncbi:hypothetical protein GSI_08346 [Ganoderma sinense ZZ0214-1]|uniref:Uncharacterized protein n=1 Tax=Ganoderma sinense ZZ0214-1 TaxID=1077348 RepID=A0A2G8S7L2_9APHY|nr:hypothetical protein GSI_08346 [Ganoderma sinense ZZ0214-1]
MKAMLNRLSGLSEEMHGAQSDENPASLALSGLNVMMSKGWEDLSIFSDFEFLELHNTVRNLAKCKDECFTCQFLVEAVRMSEAVDTLLAWATSRDIGDSGFKPLDIVFIDPPAVPDFLATANIDETALKAASKVLYHKACSRWKCAPFDPSESPSLAGVSAVEGAPGRFTGPGVVHCVPSILYHVLQSNIASTIYPYIGSSYPVCYACHSLVRACHWVTHEPFSTVGRRSYDMEWLDPAWSCPPLGSLQLGEGPAILKRLERNVMDDFKEICMHMDSPHPGVHVVRDLGACKGCILCPLAARDTRQT